MDGRKDEVYVETRTLQILNIHEAIPWVTTHNWFIVISLKYHKKAILGNGAKD
jgi:hypothetical protein